MEGVKSKVVVIHKKDSQSDSPIGIIPVYKGCRNIGKLRQGIHRG